MNKKYIKPWELSNGIKDTIIRWTYLIIVIAASITMAFLLKENRQIAEDIQQDRKRVTFDACLDQNARHRELMQFLKDENARTPIAIKFVNILASERNCQQLIISIYGSPINESS